jgi:hypothetical protein
VQNNEANIELDDSLNLEVVITENNLNNSQSSTMSAADPLNTSLNDVEDADKTSSFSCDEHSSDIVVEINDEANNNKVSSKENNNVSEVRSTRKTRNSGGKLTESTNVPEKKTITNKRKPSMGPRKQIKKQKISPKKEVEEPQESENINLIEDDACEEYLSSPEG